VAASAAAAAAIAADAAIASAVRSAGTKNKSHKKRSKSHKKARTSKSTSRSGSGGGGGGGVWCARDTEGGLLISSRLVSRVVALSSPLLARGCALVGLVRVSRVGWLAGSRGRIRRTRDALPRASTRIRETYRRR
jgi:hypothetical protein